METNDPRKIRKSQANESLKTYSGADFIERRGILKSSADESIKPRSETDCIERMISTEPIDFMDIWKSQVNEHIKTYSEADLNVLIVKSARKSMKNVLPGIWIRVMCIAVIIYLIQFMLWGNSGVEMKMLRGAGLAILSVSYFLWERSAYKMNRYRLDMPVKEWLEHRIREVEKTIRYHSRYDWLIYSGSFLLGFCFYAATLLLVKDSFHWVVFVIVLSGFVIFTLFIKRYNKKKYARTLHELKELHGLLEE